MTFFPFTNGRKHILKLQEKAEDEYEYLCNNYGHLVKKLTLNEFQDLLDNMDFPVDVHISNI